MRSNLTNEIDGATMMMEEEEEAELAFRIQKGLEAEARGRKELEQAYCQGYDSGFLDGMTAGYEKGECETWDEAYSAGWKAAKEE